MRFIVCLALVVSAAAVWADDAPWSIVGNAGNFTNNKQIRMASEDVRIRLTNDRMRVHVLFIFKNEGPATKVTMAFPDGVEDFKPRKPKDPMAILWMKSTVDGKSVRTTRHKLPKAEHAEYTHVWLKEVAFAAHQTRTVTVDYEATHGDRGDFVSDYYILQTGAFWKGTIGKAVITVDSSAMKGFTPVTFFKVPRPVWSGENLAYKSVASRVARFEFTNLKPNFDLAMHWAKAFWSFNVNGRWTKGYPSAQDYLFTTPDGRNPEIDIDYLAKLLTFEESDEPTSSFLVGKHTIRVEGKKLLIDGRRIKTEQGFVRVRDVVKALKGDYRYDAKTDRAYIKI